ncbi:DUF2332 domain-containing protein [Microbacterium sp. C7(2022)]|uniref:DUF2332 domain-containing protein n=1 Tax=Microbacterium sp. C7(2022) TaxID=2992759 RepID=UPI00237A98EB|nr:DUF2332 domain-containing protein [Microbacterium sp. C7(2022)]MDE0547119.1 DUF2332 domain-containing protein [Microbacterium sp. C7(2022)]
MTDASREDVAAVVERYGRFARDEAPGRSALYAEWATGVAATPDIANIVARIAPTRRQPPLVFGVSRMLGAPEETFAEWAEWLRSHSEEVVAECGRRMLQTNEPLRCAALLPALAAVEGPIALIEIGASAGLCMIPDAYAYDYSGVRLEPALGDPRVELMCAVEGPVPLRMPEVVWRAGIDLAPLDASDPGDRRFLTSLVWPEEDERRRRIEGALSLAAQHSLRIVAGDATDAALLRSVLDEAPRDATVVVTTPGVLPHIARAGRERLAQTLRSADVTWISIEPGWMRNDPSPAARDPRAGSLLLTNDRAMAWVDPLGARMEWRADSSAAAS